MKNFSYFFTPNQWNNSTSFSLLSSHNNAIISQLNGTKKRHLWKTVCFSFKTIPFFKRSKYHDLRNLQHENQDAKKTKKILSPLIKKSTFEEITLPLCSLYYEPFLQQFIFFCFIFLRFMNGLMFISRLCAFHERIFITNSSSFHNQKIVARIFGNIPHCILGQPDVERTTGSYYHRGNSKRSGRMK